MVASGPLLEQRKPLSYIPMVTSWLQYILTTAGQINTTKELKRIIIVKGGKWDWKVYVV